MRGGRRIGNCLEEDHRRDSKGLLENDNVDQKRNESWWMLKDPRIKSHMILLMLRHLRWREYHLNPDIDVI